MESNIEHLKRASTIFKVLAGVSLVGGLLLIVAISVPSIAILLPFLSGGGMGSSVTGFNPIASTPVLVLILAVVIRFIGVVLTFFALYTIAIVLEFLSRLGEETLILRRIQWKQLQLNQREPNVSQLP